MISTSRCQALFVAALLSTVAAGHAAAAPETPAPKTATPASGAQEAAKPKQSATPSSGTPQLISGGTSGRPKKPTSIDPSRAKQLPGASAPSK
jgi:hypothetical protein